MEFFEKLSATPLPQKKVVEEFLCTNLHKDSSTTSLPLITLILVKWFYSVNKYMEKY